MAGDDDELFLTGSLNVTPKTKEHHLTVRSDKFKAEEEECARGIVVLKLTILTDKKHRAASLRQQGYL